MKKRMIALLLALLVCASFAGCGGAEASAPSSSASSPKMEMSMADSAPAEEALEMEMETTETAVMDTGAGASQPAQNDKIIITMHYETEATDFPAATTALMALVTELGGYPERASSGGDVGYRDANYTFRIPKEKLADFTAQVGEVCHVLYSEQEQENVSEVYYDMESRLTALRTTETRLLALLERAESMEDIITLETALSDTLYEIESLTGSLRGYDNKIDYSTVHVSVREVRGLTAVREQPTFGEEVQQAFVGGLQNLVRICENLVIFVAYNWLGLLIWVGIGYAVYRVVRKLRKKRAQQKENKPS